MLQNIGLFIL
jgi:calpain